MRGSPVPNFLGVFLKVKSVSVIGLSAIALTACSGDAPVSKIEMSEAALRGKEAFSQQCVLCHQVETGSSEVAPTLLGLMGREAGAINFPYSDAVKSSGIIWTPETLDRFLAEPRTYIPDNQMVFYGIDDSVMRSDLIEYIGFYSQP